MNLENTKVYTKDPEVIRKYAELCGVDFTKLGTYGKAECYYFEGGIANKFGASSHGDSVWGKLITPDQINALHAEKSGKVETPEEAEAFDIMAQDNEQLQNYEMSGLRPVIDVDGKLYTADDVRALLSLQDLPVDGWKNGDACVYDGSDYVFVGMTPTFNDVSCIIFDSKNGIEHVSVNKLRKPETPQQREERERNEWAQNVIGEMMDATGLDFTQDGDVQVVKAMYDLGYRKQKDGE